MHGFIVSKLIHKFFWQPSYVKAEGKSLSSFIPSPKCVSVIYFYDKCCNYVAFMWHDCTYIWHIRDVTYIICWICYYVGNVCDMYLVLVRVHSQLVAVSHSVHILCIFSFLYIARGICIWFRASIFKIFSSEVNKCTYIQKCFDACSCIKLWLNGQYDILEANYFVLAKRL